ncbi:sugar ABC transporter ATP-binding protein [Phyllobacterium chamaecytisi]|uniref:sugar ABC transporter ATP-binding protein n=1 Tax=Phyllobacterium chamaecytisi TaxID=2876082 RepID=UPI001CCA38B7|nr:sugar ABC transporter ATP-binding protein [Phyllobacterium sp. KW56]MBZ9605446.1 sugar ABC transporter ATP-binding protein [Phyllobacterium sp. KW56]
MNADQEVILSVRGATKVYPGTIALKSVDFDVRKGAVNVLVGENGAGKSTLMKIISGVEQPTEGTILLNGEPIRMTSTQDAIRNGIGIVFQELNLFPNMTVAENIFITREQCRFGIDIDRTTQEEKSRALMRRLEHDIAVDRPVGELRIGQQQIVEIAKALSQDARILIMDEPTSALSATEVEILFRVIAELKAQGVAIVYISHRLEELVRIGDFITVLRDGSITGSSSMKDIDVPWIVRSMIGASSKDYAKTAEHRYGNEILQIEDITLPRQGGGYMVDHVSLSLRAGEIIGIYGLMGAGRTELFDCIMGRHKHAGGTILVGGRPLPKADVLERINGGLALIPEDRKAEGLIQIMSISDNMTLASLWNYVRGVQIDGKKERATVAQYVRKLAIKIANPDNEVASLSGGNQQKVVIGKALMTDPKVLLMDEPSRGIDIGAKAEVFRTMRRLAADGLGILFVTSDLEEVMALSDRIIVMSKGRITGDFQRVGATEQAVVAASSVGHDITGQTMEARS